MSKEAIREKLQKVGSMPKPLEVQIGGETFYVRRLNGVGRTAMQTFARESRQHAEEHGVDWTGFTDSDWAAAALCDEDGNSVFDSVREGSEFIASLDGDVQTEIAKKALRANGFDLHEETDEKKSSPTQTENSGTGSPQSSETEQ